MMGSEEGSGGEGTSGPHSISEEGKGGATISGEAGVDVDIDVAQALGASKELSSQILRLYIPNKDRHQHEFGCQRKWVLEAAGLLAEIGGGVTMLPPAEGGWLDEENDTIVWESPIMVYTYVKPDKFQRSLLELRAFVHRLGRETNQGEVGLEFDGAFYRINTYDDPAKELSHEEANQRHEPRPSQNPGDKPEA